jgi:hypothetical protein
MKLKMEKEDSRTFLVGFVILLLFAIIIGTLIATGYEF